MLAAEVRARKLAGCAQHPERQTLETSMARVLQEKRDHLRALIDTEPITTPLHRSGALCATQFSLPDESKPTRPRWPMQKIASRQRRLYNDSGICTKMHCSRVRYRHEAAVGNHTACCSAFHWCPPYLTTSSENSKYQRSFFRNTAKLPKQWQVVRKG